MERQVVALVKGNGGTFRPVRGVFTQRRQTQKLQKQCNSLLVARNGSQTRTYGHTNGHKEVRAKEREPSALPGN